MSVVRDHLTKGAANIVTRLFEKKNDLAVSGLF